jgi:RHS repeat-associated protein
LATVDWVGTSSGRWNVGTNWSTGKVPGMGDDVAINPSTPLTVTIDSGTQSIDSLQAGTNAALVITGGSLTVSASSTVSDVTVTNGALLAVSALSASTLAVQQGGVVRAQGHELDLTISGEATVDATSRIDASGEGYGPGITAGGTTGPQDDWGGSYGGLGGVAPGHGQTNVVYGDYANPTDWGSGGWSYALAGAGGGLVRLTAGTLALDGEIVTDGTAVRDQYGNGPNGAGSGGGVYVSVATLQGTGSIQASGASASSAGGGGGRIAVYAGDWSKFDVTKIQALGGLGSPSGGAGTVYLKQTGTAQGTLIVNAATGGGGTTPLSLPGGGSVNSSDAVEIEGTNTHATAGSLEASSLAVVNGAVLAAQGHELDLTISGAATVDATSRIDVSGEGYGPGITAGGTTGPQDDWGGSYGGLGGVLPGHGETNVVYGDYADPTDWGSGGWAFSLAGTGGGLVRLTAGTLALDGQIVADGTAVRDQYGNGPNGAGSGGGIYVSVATLQGAGSIQASGASASSAGGGGGRIAVYAGDWSKFNVTKIQALGGTGSPSAGAGTVYLKQTGAAQGTLIVNAANGGGGTTPLSLPGGGTVNSSDAVEIEGANTHATAGSLEASSLAVLNGAVLAAQGHELDLTISGEATVDATSRIDVSGEGYGPGITAGGTTGPQDDWGGSYGGLGGVAPGHGQTNVVYGDYANPNDWGSGGWCCSLGGAGGGLVRLTAGTLALDGEIVADGTAVRDQYGNGPYGAGSGGGIYVSVATLQGGGIVQASGANAAVAGGGGGRVAVYAGDWSKFDVTKIQALGGLGSPSGGAGTVYLKQTGSAQGTLIVNAANGGGGTTPLSLPGGGTVNSSDAVEIEGADTHATAGSLEASSLAVVNGAVLAAQGHELDLTISGGATVDATSRIDVSGEGYGPRTTAGGTTGPQDDWGGSYGGLGGVAPGHGQTNVVYGDYADPTDWGSGGWCCSLGGAGGGLVRLTAGTLALDGEIVADGTAVRDQYGNGPYGAGSGGGIYVSVATLQGTGSIQASGASAAVAGGGGGRIAVYAGDWSKFDVTKIQALGGLGSPSGGAGTVYLKQTGAVQGTLIVNAANGGGGTTPLSPPGASGYTYVDPVVITGSGAHALAMDLVFQQGLTMEDSASLRVSGTVTVSGELKWHGGSIGGPGSLVIAPDGDMTVAGSSTLTLDVASLVDDGTLEVYSGIVSNSSLEIDGSGILAVSPSATLAVGGNLVGSTQGAAGFSPVGNILFDGLGTASAPQLLEVMSHDLGNVAAGFQNNFAYGTLALGNNTYVKLVDNAQNVAAQGPEALYVNALVVPTGCTLNLDGFHVYARVTQISGTVVGGTVNQPPSGGPIPLNTPTPGSISQANPSADWTFYGRAGQTVAVVVNTGSQGSLVPLQPSLDYAQVEILGPTGSVVESATNTNSGTDATLPAVQLPADGTYQVQVQAAPSQPGSTGYYLVAVWNAPIGQYSLDLGQAVTGQLTTPYAVDHWNFTAAANEQVQFKIVNSSTSGVEFDLTGPNGYSAFTNATTSSALITVPAPGNYVLTAHWAQPISDETASYGFLINETSQTNLTLGTPYQGTVAGSGQAQLFVVTIASPTALGIVLTDGGANDENEVFASRNADPTRDDYQYRSAGAGPDQTLALAAQPGTYYILVYNNLVNSPGSTYTLLAQGSTFTATDLTPRVVGNGQSDTLLVTGVFPLAYQTSGAYQIQFVSGSGSTYPASPLYLEPTSLGVTSGSNSNVNGTMTMSVTVPAGSLPAGTYSVRVVDSLGDMQSLDSALTVTEGGAGLLKTNLSIPRFISYYQAATLYVAYSNIGTAPLAAPILVLTAVLGSKQGALLSLDPADAGLGYDSSTTPAGFSQTVQFLASGTVPGVLEPGESVTVPVYYGGWLVPADWYGNTVSFSLGRLDTTDTQTIDWNSVGAGMRPGSINQAAWDAIFPTLTANLGSTWGQYIQTLDNDAVYLAGIGEPTNDLSQLLSFEIEKANAAYTAQTLTSVTADSLPAPGLDLSFVQSFQQSISGRYTEGILGYGWTTNWDISAATMTNGDVVVDDGISEYFSLQPNGSFAPEAGDEGTTLIPNRGAYQLVDPDGSIYAFNTNGTLNYVEDTNGNTITAGYNSQNQLTSLTDSNKEQFDLTYNSAGRLTTLTDSAGQTEMYTYDSANNLLMSYTDAYGTTKYTYVTDGSAAQDNALETITNASQTQVLFTYDPSGRLVDEQSNGGAEDEKIGYLSRGGYTTTDADRNKTTTYFNLYGATAETIDPLGNITRYYYDNNLNLIKVIGPGGSTENYSYDRNGNLTSETDPLGLTTTFTYDPNNDLTSYSDAKGNTTSYAYDTKNNLLSITYANGTEQQYSYNPLGEAKQYLNADGQAIGYTYNTQGLVATETFADNTSYSYTYNAQGNLVSATDAHGNVETFVYGYNNNPNLLAEVEYPDGTWLKFQYNAIGQRTQSVDQTGFTVKYNYDPLGRLSELTDGSGNLIVHYIYDNAGNLTQKDNGNGTFTIYTYDGDGDVLSITNYAPSTGSTSDDPANSTVNSFDDYTYDDLGNVLTDTSQDGEWVYTYDADSQLIHAVFTPNSTDPDAVAAQNLQYVYDAAGNRISETVNGVTTIYVTNNVNEYTSSVTNGLTTTYQYDADGNLIGQATGGSATTYTFNDVNELAAVNGPDVTASYGYDPLGNLVSQRVNGSTSGFQVDPIGLGNVVATIGSGGAVTGHYTYGLGLVSQVSSTGTAGYYDFNNIGSAVGITGAGGVYANKYAYLPFGQATAIAAAASNPFTFVGQFGVQDDGAGLLGMQARAYDPATGRFTSRDPLGVLSGDVNRDRYAENNPTGLVDPSGLGDGLPTDIQKEADEIARARYEAEKELYGEDYANRERARRAQQYENGRKAMIGIGTNAATMGIKSFPISQILGYLLGWLVKDYGKIEPTPPVTPSITKSMFNGVPIDPNSMIGPAGYGIQNFVSDTALLPYEIFYENEPIATAPAQRVDITDQLDPNLNWSMFQLSAVGFGSTYIAIPAGLQHYDTTVNVTENGQNFEVVIDLNLDPATGVFTASLQSIDPTTGLPPASLQTGFLPPEDGTGRGMGFVRFTVSTKAGLPTSTEIRNVAGISFNLASYITTDQVDDQDPSKGIDPNKQALVTIDAGPPTSSVGALPSTESSTSFPVNWSGHDDPGGSGVAFYNVYVSDNGGQFAPWESDTTETSATFAGQFGHTYGFYSVATDNVGNVQPRPTAAQATTNLQMTAPPTQPPPPALLPADDSGTKGDGITDDASPSLIGTTEPGASDQLLNAKTVIATTTADTTGNYTFAVPDAPLTAGNYMFAVVATNAGGSSPPSNPFTLTIVAPPTTPSAPTLSQSDSNGSPGGETTYSTSPHLVGTTAPSATVQLLDASGTVVATTNADHTGAYAVQVPGPLALGAHTYRVQIIDQYGDSSTPSPSGTITVASRPAPLVSVTKVKDTPNKKHQVTQVLVTFSGPVNTTEADNIRTYRLTMPGKGGSYTAKGATPITLKSAVYNTKTETVTLTPIKPFALTKPVQLLVYGTGPHALKDSNGRPIDGAHKGKPGSNAVAILSSGGAKVEAVTTTRLAGRTPSPVATMVDALLERNALAGVGRTVRRDLERVLLREQR